MVQGFQKSNLPTGTGQNIRAFFDGDAYYPVNPVESLLIFEVVGLDASENRYFDLAAHDLTIIPISLSAIFAAPIGTGTFISFEALLSGVPIWTYDLNLNASSMASYISGKNFNFPLPYTIIEKTYQIRITSNPSVARMRIYAKRVNVAGIISPTT